MADLRIDVMSRMRGVDPFPELWERRSTIDAEAGPLELLSLPDLVRAKKTQRNKDWPMIRRLVEQSVYSTVEPTEQKVRFWLEELRSPELLVEMAVRRPVAAAECPRMAVKAAISGELEAIEEALEDEQKQERVADREYWKPLRAELEPLRRKHE